MAKLTENELKLIKFIADESEFNCDSLDFTKSFEEQRLEDEDNFISFVEIKKYNKLLGTNNEGSRAILGSLVKKNLCYTMKEEDHKPALFWLYINKENFENIVAALKEQGEL